MRKRVLIDWLKSKGDLSFEMWIWLCECDEKGWYLMLFKRTKNHNLIEIAC